MLLTAGTKMTIQVKVTQDDPTDGYYNLKITSWEWHYHIKLEVLNNKQITIY